ncbi:ribose 5-phosphate isomerase A [Myxococcota bacterium]|nr:ribose 5-phosphate isomerase A [Myxococcota bacterium]
MNNENIVELKRRADLLELKRRSALAAIESVEDGMVLGLGTGSTASIAVHAIGERYQQGELKNITSLATSEQTAKIALQYELPLIDLDSVAEVDLAIDGADEVDPSLDMIKGLGGALLREKAVELKARKFIVIVDESKLVQKLGEKSPVPVEVPQDSWEAVSKDASALGAEPKLRKKDDRPFISDNGNYIIDYYFEPSIPDPRELAAKLASDERILAHGLFLDMATEVIIASPDGLERKVR